MKPLHDKLARAMEEGTLPNPEAETPLQRFRRVLALSGGCVRPAASMSFTPARAIEAAAIAHQLPRGQQ